ncbi:hypothetical protein [Streptomyces sp. NPDC006274]|uniref:hypothetical protein n=1 Tax=unclassified Streptomyces TaxID=2593676 RepID=UPI0033B4F667
MNEYARCYTMSYCPAARVAAGWALSAFAALGEQPGRARFAGMAVSDRRRCRGRPGLVAEAVSTVPPRKASPPDP